MELTQEHFNKQFEELNKRLDQMATKADLQQQTKELEAYTNEVAATILEAIDIGFEGVKKDELDRNKRLETVENDVRQLKGALDIS